MMRIITGKARGIRLKTLEGEATRPTSERVKEAVFSMLQLDVEGRTVLDLFAGSGQMALEALSRGATEAVLVDRSAEAIRIIQDNVKKTGFERESSVVRLDSLDFVRQNRGRQFDLIFIDPPYASDLYTRVLRSMLENNMIKPSSLIICESDREDVLGAFGTENFTVRRSSRYGRSFINILTLKETEEQI